jgi:hypothetical protein
MKTSSKTDSAGLTLQLAERPSENRSALGLGSAAEMAVEVFDSAGSADAVASSLSAYQTANNAALALKAPLASPALTGTPTAPTAAVATNTTQIATTAYVRGEVAALVASSPSTLDTLNELATALGNDPNFATTVSTTIGTKLARSSNLSDLTDIDAARANLGVDLTLYLRRDGDATLNGELTANAFHGVPTETSGSSALVTDFDITATSGTYVDTGLSITLPSAGTYLVIADVQAQINISAGSFSYITVQLRNFTDSTFIANTIKAPAFTPNSGVLVLGCAAIFAIITVASSKSIRLFAARNGTTPTYSVSRIQADANGVTGMRFIKLGV